MHVGSTRRAIPLPVGAIIAADNTAFDIKTQNPTVPTYFAISPPNPDGILTRVIRIVPSSFGAHCGFALIALRSYGVSDAVWGLRMEVG